MGPLTWISDAGDSDISTPARGAPSQTTPLPVSVRPYVVTTFPARSLGGAEPPSTTVWKAEAVTRASAVGTRDTSTWGPAAPMTWVAAKPAWTSTGVPVSSARVTTERPPMWLRGRHASHR